MSIKVYCPECNKTYRVRDEHAGKRGKCKHGHRFKIPTAFPVAAVFEPAVRPPLSRPARSEGWKLLLLLGGAGAVGLLLVVMALIAGCVLFIRAAAPNLSI
jgi:hypothetical protein